MTSEIMTHKFPVAVCNQVKSVEKLTDKPILHAANQLSEWMKGSDSMLAISPEKLVSLIEEGQYVVLVSQGKVVAGCGLTIIHEGVTEAGIYSHIVELGGLVVSPDSLGQGFGKSAAIATLMIFAETASLNDKLITYPNNKSIDILMSLGAKPLSEEETILTFPVSVYNVCLVCPKGSPEWGLDVSMQAKIRRCCDKPYMFDLMSNND